MRKFIFIFLVAGFLSAQEAVIYQNTYLTPDRKSEQKLVQGVKMHNFIMDQKLKQHFII